MIFQIQAFDDVITSGAKGPRELRERKVQINKEQRIKSAGWVEWDCRAVTSGDIPELARSIKWKTRLQSDK